MTCLVPWRALHMSFKSRRFSLMELWKGKAVVFCEVAGVRLDLVFLCPPEIYWGVCTASWRGWGMVFMVTEAWHFKNATCKSLFLSVSFLFSFIQYPQVLHTVSPLSSPPFFLHPPAPENVNLHGFKYAHSELGVNHHFVFITCSLSSLSRCERGMRNRGVRKYWCCFWLQTSVFQWALPRGCSSSALVFRPNENSDWLEGCQLAWLN